MRQLKSSNDLWVELTVVKIVIRRLKTKKVVAFHGWLSKGHHQPEEYTALIIFTMHPPFEIFDTYFCFPWLGVGVQEAVADETSPKGVKAKQAIREPVTALSSRAHHEGYQKCLE